MFINQIYLEQFKLESRIYNYVCVSIDFHLIQLHNYMNAASIVASLAQFHHTFGEYIRFKPTSQPICKLTCNTCDMELQQT